MQQQRIRRAVMTDVLLFLGDNKTLRTLSFLQRAPRITDRNAVLIDLLLIQTNNDDVSKYIFVVLSKFTTPKD
jgi:hypothetical protein